MTTRALQRLAGPRRERAHAAFARRLPSPARAMHARALAARAVVLVLGAASCRPARTDVAAPVGRTSPVAPEAPPGAGASLASTTFAIAGAEASPVTFERMSRWPEPGGQVPRSIAFSPDGRWITYLQSENQDDETALFGFDRVTRQVHRLLRAADLGRSATTLSREEELRRERQRQKIKGITSYHFARRAPVMVIPLDGDVFLRHPDGKVVRLTETPEPEIDPRPCDSGERVAFVRRGELFAVDVRSKVEVQLTRGAPSGVTRGLSDFNAQEEFDEPSGYFWSPRCDRLAYFEVDERGVDEVPIAGYRGGRAEVMMQRYPVPGAKNPVVKLWVVDVASRRASRVALPPDDHEPYLGRFVFSPDGRALFFEAISRDQKRRELVRGELDGSSPRVLATETSPAFVELGRIWPLARSSRLLWVRDRGGYRHIDLLDASTGARIAPVTAGAWDVESIAGVDEERGRVLFTATKDGPLERHLYSAPLSGGGEPVRLTAERGKHEIVKDERSDGWVDLSSAIDRPPRAVVHDAGEDGELPCPLDPDLDQLRLRPLETVKIRGPSGDDLYGSLLRPRQTSPGVRHPLVVVVYGGPHVQTVQNQWSPKLLWQHLADRGVAVFQLDNRGTPARGRAFEQATYGRLGELELEDQLAGVEALAKMPFIDGARIGIYGHSYGGYMAALAMLRAPGRFKVGIAASPVTDWRLYDSGYTERFMGAPGQNPRGYAEDVLADRATDLSGKLLIVHAMMDENVHFEHSVRLIDALILAEKPFDLLTLPGERHGTRDPKVRRYVNMRIVDYLARNL